MQKSNILKKNKLTLPLALISSFSFAQDQCGDILEGLVNTHNEWRDTYHSDRVEKAMCSKELQEKYRKAGGGAGGSVLWGIVSGSGSGYSQRTDKWLNEHCSTFDRNRTSVEALTLLKTVTNEFVTGSWERCMQNKQTNNAKAMTCEIDNINHDQKYFDFKVFVRNGFGDIENVKITSKNSEIDENEPTSLKSGNEYIFTFNISDVSKDGRVKISGKSTHLDSAGCIAGFNKKPIPQVQKQVKEFDLCEYKRSYALKYDLISQERYDRMKREDYVPSYNPKNPNRVHELPCKYVEFSK